MKLTDDKKLPMNDTWNMADGFRQFLEYGRIAGLYLDESGILIYATPLMQEIAGIGCNDYGHDIQNTELVQLSPDLRAAVDELRKDIQEARQNSSSPSIKTTLIKSYQVEITGKDHIDYLVLLQICSAQDNAVQGILLNFQDQSEKKEARAVIELEKEKSRLTAELMDCAFWEYDIREQELHQTRKIKGKYFKNNRSIKKYRSFALEKGWVHPEDIAVFHQYCDSMDRGEESLQYELRIMGDNNEYIWVRYEGVCLRNTLGSPLFIIGRTINIDKEHREADKLLHKSRLDPLTGLYNRNATKEIIEQCLQESVASGLEEICNFMIIDIDDFRKTNDAWGHFFGDLLLENFAKNLENFLDSTDIAGRIGGDQFVVLQQGITRIEDAQETARKISDIAGGHLMGTPAGDKITVSIGISVFPKDGVTYDALYQKADRALHNAKAQGKNQHHLYEPGMEEAGQDKGQCSRHWIRAELIDRTTPEMDKRLFNYAVDIVNRSQDVKAAIQKIIREIGNYYDLSRIVICENAFHGTQTSISYEWCNTGIPSAKTPGPKEAYDRMEACRNHYGEKGVHYINDIEAADISPLQQSYYRSGHIRALVQCTISCDRMEIGCISYEDCVAARRWDKRDLDTLYTLTKLISTYIIQLNHKKVLDNELFFTQATLNNQKLCNYAVREGTHQLVYFSNYTRKLHPNAAQGESCYRAIYHRDFPCDPCPLNGLCDGNQSYSIEAYNNETASWYSSTASRLTDPEGGAIWMVTTSDVTGFIERVNAKDPMTGLLTLSRFEAEGMRLLAENREQKYFVMYCDFDKFKNINDEWGYSTGNEILMHFARKTGKLIKKNELFCRITADIFVMLLTYKDREEILERINYCYSSIIKDLNNSFLGVNVVLISGIYFLNPENRVLSIAIDRANLARKTIKGVHKSSYAIYDNLLHEKIMKENMVESNMYSALKNKEFVVYLQPKVDLETLRITGAEALVRWRLPQGELMNPAEFIPIFEKNGFIAEMDFYVYEVALGALRDWIDQGKNPIILSLNVSRMHLDNSNFTQRLILLLDKYGIPANLIELEITENIFLNDLDRLLHFVKSLRKQGFLISIDDFGSGYSSLNLLKTLPIDILKLDREFFMENTMGVQDKIIISGIISLAKGLGLKVVSEGVETAEQMEFIRESRCDMAQGYLFYKPVPMDEFEQLLD